MGMVDSQNLKWEVRAKYPYSTHICETEQDAINKVMEEWILHRVPCQVRVVGEPVTFLGAPKRYKITTPWLLRVMERDGIEQPE